MDKKRKLNRFEMLLRGDNLLLELERVMYCEEFDDESRREEILGEMPDVSKFHEDCRRGKSRRCASGVPAELVSLYGQGVMSREQEHHEFRKYNFYKYLALQVLREGGSDISMVGQLEVRRLVSKALEVKKFLISSNLRLAVDVAKKFAYGTNQQSRLWDLFAECSYGIMRCVICFDYTRGIKFGTYATWGCRANLGRETWEHKHHQRCYVSGLDKEDYDIGREDDSDYEINDYNDRVRDVVKNLLGKIDKRNGEVISRYMLDGDEPTLEQLGKEFGVTKERIRQLKTAGMKKLREIIVREGIELGDLVLA
jgi:RNA polymerase sigma factor (sigma-70 family)